MDNETFSNIKQFKSSISQSSHLISSSHLSFSLYLFSPNCFHSQVPLSIVFTPGKAVELVLVQNELEINSCSLNISIPIICVDPIGFIVECSGNVTIVASTFNFTSYELLSNELNFFNYFCFNFDHHRLELMFSTQLSESHLTFVQQHAQILEVNTYDVLDCSHQMLFDKSCTVLRPFVQFITQQQFSNISETIPLSEIVFSSTKHNTDIVAINDVVEIGSYPLQSLSVTVSYFSQSVTLKISANDCPFPKLNFGHGCLCPRGMEFNSLGECVECALNYYSNSEFNSECRSCPIPRITLQKGSSDLDHCICPLNTLDSIDSCLPCPHLAECGYGNLTGIEPGFRLNTDTWDLDECDIWFNCHANSCRSRHAYGDLCQYCTEDAISTRIFCLGKEHLLIKLMLLMILIVVIVASDQSMSKCLNLKQGHHNVLLLSASKNFRYHEFRSISRFINYVFTTLFTVSIITTKSSNTVLVFFEFILSAFRFDLPTYLFVRFYFNDVFLYFSSCYIQEIKTI
ncbi:hypothetical protein GEMRC1_009095 [Eukaryota sp. GEM-RC1]